MYVLLCYELADSLNSFGRIKVTPADSLNSFGRIKVTPYLCSANSKTV